MRSLFHAFFMLLVAVVMTGCTRWYFAPHKQWAFTPDRIGLQYRDLSLVAADGTHLHAWLLPASSVSKGRVLFLHGNGENISTHIASVYWLPAAGYDVLLLDYRGYGHSGGQAALPEVLLDIDAAWQALQQTTDNSKPAFIFGQSIGAALAYQWMSTRQPQDVTAVIYDSGFARYPDMVRKVLRETWLTRWLSTPLSWLFSHRHDPQRVAALQPVIPRLFLHSREDRIVPLEQGLALYQANTQQACLLEGQGPHINMVQQAEVRQQLVTFLSAPQDWLAGCEQGRASVARTVPVWLPLPPLR